MVMKWHKASLEAEVSHPLTSVGVTGSGFFGNYQRIKRKRHSEASFNVRVTCGARNVVYGILTWYCSCDRRSHPTSWLLTPFSSFSDPDKG